MLTPLAGFLWRSEFRREYQKLDRLGVPVPKAVLDELFSRFDTGDKEGRPHVGRMGGMAGWETCVQRGETDVIFCIFCGAFFFYHVALVGMDGRFLWC